jgi:predicted lactoylglutathione lyase
MPQMIFVNLPVTDLARSTAFYEALGGKKNPQFSDATATCIVFSDTIHAMLLTHEKYSSFTTRPIADARTTSAVLLAMSADSKDAVNAIANLAAASGGRADPNPMQDLGFMFSRSVEDPDGHVWEYFWMDPAAMGSALLDDEEYTRGV